MRDQEKVDKSEGFGEYTPPRGAVPRFRQPDVARGKLYGLSRLRYVVTNLAGPTAVKSMEAIQRAAAIRLAPPSARLIVSAGSEEVECKSPTAPRL